MSPELLPCRPIGTQSTVQKHIKRAEDHAQAANEQSRAALKSIFRSMEDVRTAIAEAKRARDRYHDLFSVSSQSRKDVRRSAMPATHPHTPLY